VCSFRWSHSRLRRSLAAKVVVCEAKGDGHSALARKDYRIPRQPLLNEVLEDTRQRRARIWHAIIAYDEGTVSQQLEVEEEAEVPQFLQVPWIMRRARMEASTRRSGIAKSRTNFPKFVALGMGSKVVNCLR
jgi:hypothetical protein